MPESTPRERLLMALEMADLGEQMVRSRIRREHPDLEEAGVQEAIARWRRDRPGAPHGDYPGRLAQHRLDRLDRRLGRVGHHRLPD
ncbi:MAG: hypothetical protein M9891_00850 [Austwickia sp.]|nr:hypothetical protein [Austwickia sp.]MCO5307839.1 hypothetical protein [Austwickia sp.]